MRTTSNNYNPFRRVRNVDFDLRFGVVLDSDIMKGCTVSGTSAYIGSKESAINNVNPIADKYATLEKNAWHLDGTYKIMPDTMKAETGYWSSKVSGSDGTFDSAVALTFTFGSTVSTLGWTFIFDTKANEYASQVDYITYKADGTQIAIGTFYPDSAEYEARIQCEDYKSVKFFFRKTNNPYRRIRLIELVFGANQDYNRLSLVNLSIDYGTSLTASSMPTRKLSFTFDNSDKKYNLLNPDDVFQYLQKGQEITCKCLIDGEVIDMGTFYFNQVSAAQSAITPTIEAYDKAINMEDRKLTGSNTKVSLQTAIEAITANYGMKYNYHGNQNTQVVKAFEEGMSVRKAVHLLAQAACCSVWIDRDNVMHFYSIPIKSTADAVYTGNELYDFSGITLDAEIDGVVLNVNNPYEPYTDEISGQTKYGVRRSYETTGASSEDKIRTFDNPCVAPENGQTVANWLLQMVNRRKTYKVKERCNPAVEIGDTVNIEDAFGNQENAVVTGLSLTYDGCLYSDTEAYG